MEITCVTFDCQDPVAVAGFWNAALGLEGIAIQQDGAAAVCAPGAGGSYLEFVRVPEGKLVKNRVHLGCSAGTLEELDRELTRLQSLGASVAWEEDFPREVATAYRNVILRDVEGNEFCLSAGSLPR